MFELYIPYVIGVLLGIAPVDDGAVTAEAEGKGKTEEVASEVAPEVAPEVAAMREPETQIATGRFTTAIEVKPILTATMPSWVAVREYDGQDLLYFTNLLSWRCGLWEVRYGLNGAPAETVLPLEPCYEDTAAPNAMVDVVAWPIWITAPLGSIESIDIEIDYDDGTMDAAVFARQSVLMPG